MTEKLDDLGAVCAKYDLDSAEAAHTEAQERVASVAEELASQLEGEDAEMDTEAQTQVREAYDQVAREEVEALKTDEYGVTEFPEAATKVADELEDILRSPQAEAVVEEIFSWLLATGLPTLSEEKEEELRSVVKEDIDAARSAVRDAKSAHDNLRGYLGDVQEEIDEMILEDVRNVSSISDLEKLAEGLTKLNEAWVGDWRLDFTTDAGERLYMDLVELLEGKLADWVEDHNSINSLAAVLEGRSERIGRRLERIEEEWSDIESRVSRLDSEWGSVTADRALTLIENWLGPSPPLNQYQSVLEKTGDALKQMEEAQRFDLGQYHPPSSEIPDALSSSVDELAATVEKTENALEAIFTATELETIQSNVKALEGHREDLKEAMKSLREQVRNEIEASRRLATKFDLAAQQEELNSLYNRARSADSVEELVTVFRAYEAVAGEVQETVREELTETQEELFTFLLGQSEEVSEGGELWAATTEQLKREREALISDLATLEEMGLVQIGVEVQ